MTVSMSAVWERTTGFLNERPAAVAGIAVLAIFLPAAVNDSLTPLRQAGTPAVRFGLSVLALGFGVLALWAQLAITALAVDPARDPAAARAIATRRLPAMIGVAVALAVLALVLTLPVLATLYVNGIDLARLNQPGAVQTLSVGASGCILLYLLILVPLGLVLTARLAVQLGPVVVVEGLVIGALGRAFRLSRGLTWRIIGVILLYLIVMFVATLAAATVFGGVFRLLLGGDGAITLASVLTAIFGAAVSTVFSVIGTAFCAKLYLAARAREDAAPA